MFKKILLPTNRSNNSELSKEKSKREKLEELLDESGVDLKEIMSVSPIPKFAINKDHEVIYWNRALEKLSKIKAEKVLGTKEQWKVFYDTQRPCMADFIVDGHLEEIPKWYSTTNNRSKFVLRYQGEDESKTLGNSCEAISFFPKMGEKGKWLHFTVDAIKNLKGDVIGAVETFEDVTNQIHLQEEFMKIRGEKEILLKEVQQRTQNDLQIIHSMINFQSYYLEDEKSRELLREIQEHTKAIPTIHEKLYQYSDLLNIDFGDFIRSLTSDLERQYIDENQVQVEVDVKEIQLDINTAIPCGLMVNELVTDSIKRSILSGESGNNTKNRILTGVSEEDAYENPEEKKNRIAVKITDEGEFFLMTIYDNARVFPENPDPQNTSTLSMWFVNKLAAQLGGTVDLEQENGTLFKITFKELQ
jgi:two-component sensor histidine kinase